MDYRNKLAQLTKAAYRAADKASEVDPIVPTSSFQRWLPGAIPALALAIVIAVITVAVAISGVTKPAVKTIARTNPGSSGAPASASSAKSSNPVTVHVVGAVNKPGLVTLKNGQRVADAITQAGGLAVNAQPSSINLARVVVDGEQIIVAALGANTAEGASSSGADSTSNNAGSNLGVRTSGLVNINSADESALQQLDGIGPALAKRIVEFRRTNGRFGHIDDLDNVPGIGPSLLSRLRPQVCV